MPPPIQPSLSHNALGLLYAPSRYITVPRSTGTRPAGHITYPSGLILYSPFPFFQPYIPKHKVPMVTSPPACPPLSPPSGALRVVEEGSQVLLDVGGDVHHAGPHPGLHLPVPHLPALLEGLDRHGRRAVSRQTSPPHPARCLSLSLSGSSLSLSFISPTQFLALFLPLLLSVSFSPHFSLSLCRSPSHPYCCNVVVYVVLFCFINVCFLSIYPRVEKDKFSMRCIHISLCVSLSLSLYVSFPFSLCVSLPFSLCVSLPPGSRIWAWRPSLCPSSSVASSSLPPSCWSASSTCTTSTTASSSSQTCRPWWPRRKAPSTGVLERGWEAGGYIRGRCRARLV